MNKSFKRSVLATLVVLASAGAYAAEKENNFVAIATDFNVDLYGVAAISVFSQEDDSGYNFDNESRVGVKANKDMFDGVNIFLQAETGYFGDDGKDGGFGSRDTFIGVQGKAGKIRFGRMLTPLYEIVDWPFSNPGLGRVFDGGGDVKAHYDRKGDMARYDSPDFDGFTFSVSLGRGDTDTDGSDHLGASVRYKIDDIVTLLGGFESNSKFAGSDIDSTAYIAGFELPFAEKFSISAAYKYNEGESKHDGDKHGAKDYSGEKGKQSQYSIVGTYSSAPWAFRLGYAFNQQSKVNGNKLNDDDAIISGQVAYSYNGFVPYLRVGSHSAGNDGKAGNDSDKMFARVGLEFSF